MSPLPGENSTRVRRLRRWRSALFAATALCLASCEAPARSSDPAAAPSSDTLPAFSADETAPPPPATSIPASADDAATSDPATSPAPLTALGWGPIRVGMTRAEVVAAAGEDANPGAVGGPEPEACDQFRPERAPEGMLVMIERDRLTRITLSAGSIIKTERGFGVGDPAAQIEEAYGAAAVSSPHKYSPAPAEYITVWMTPPGGPDARGLVYEIGTDGRVAHVHAGGLSIQYVEGCL